MNKKLNWNKFQTLKRRPIMLILISFLPATLFIQATSSQEDEIIAKTKSVDVDGVMKAFTAMRNVSIGADFPCGFEMGIALEDLGRYIFSAQSGWLATILPGDDDHTPPAEGWGGAKLKDSKIEKMSYQYAIERTKNLSIGTFEGAFGKRWAITDEQAIDFYDQVHTVNLGGETHTAFDHNNMFYEGLITTQALLNQTEEQAALINELTSQNELLTDRLEHIEQLLNVHNNDKGIGKIVISPNPGKTNMVTIDYQLFQEVNNASFAMIDMQGKLVYKADLENSKGNLRINNNLPAGTYLCYLYNNSFRSIAEKIIIQ